MHIDGFSMLPLWKKPVNANLLLGHNDSRFNSGHRLSAPAGVVSNFSSNIGARYKAFRDHLSLRRTPLHRQLSEQIAVPQSIRNSKSIDYISRTDTDNDILDIEAVFTKNDSHRQLSNNKKSDESTRSNRHYRGQKLINEISQRLYFWHRDTENFNDWDDRVQSSIVMGGEYKLMTTQNGMCLYRFFHLKTDPREHHNIINTRRVPLKQWDRASVEAALASTSTGDSNSNLIRRDVPVHIDICNGHMLASAGQQQGNWKDIVRYFDLTVLSTIGRCSKSNNYIDCVMKTASDLLDILGLLVPELVKFVRNANKGHQEYMISRMKENTCKVPSVSEIKNLNFGPETYPRHYTYY
jgi:hypothetical protein